MNDSAILNVENWLSQARGGSADALGRLLAAYMNYLKMLAQMQMDERLRRRVGASDIVQETLLEAHRDLLNFVGKTPAEFSGWLRSILINKLKRAIECHVLTAKRDVRRELSLEELRRKADRSAARLARVRIDSAGASIDAAIGAVGGNEGSTKNNLELGGSDLGAPPSSPETLMFSG